MSGNRWKQIVGAMQEKHDYVMFYALLLVNDDRLVAQSLAHDF